MNFEIVKVNEVYGGEAYLITSGDDVVLIDTGYAVGVEGTILNIKKALNGRELRHIFLSHSHYDHVMGSPAISNSFRQAKIYAHPRVREIFKKPHAKEKMEEMNKSAAKERGLSAKHGWTEKLHVDVDIEDGEIINIGKLKIKVLWTPGHTKDCVSYYFENEKFLFASESLGVPLSFPGVVPGFVVSYEDSMNSITKVRKLDIKRLLLPHSKVIEGNDIDTYFENSIKESSRVHDIIYDAHNEGYSIKEIVEKLKNIYHIGKFKKYQPNSAFYANWIPLVTKVIEKQNRW